MAAKRVICYGMHEIEIHAAGQALTNAEATPGFVLGDIDDADIPALEAQGLIVEVLEDVEAAAISPSS